MPPGRSEQREQALALDQSRHVRGKRWPLRPWTAGELALLGTMTDGEVAARVGRSRQMVRRERVARGIPEYGSNGWVSRGGSGLLVHDELLRALRTESATAVEK